MIYLLCSFLIKLILVGKTFRIQTHCDENKNNRLKSIPNQEFRPQLI